MAFYDLSKPERDQLVKKINLDIAFDLTENLNEKIIRYFSDEDTYIRKTGYLAIAYIVSIIKARWQIITN